VTSNPTQPTFKSIVLCLFFAGFLGSVDAQQRRVPAGGRLAIVADERLSAVRVAPALSARLVQRLSRGRFVAIIASTRAPNGIKFFRVKISRRRSGWIQSDAVVSPRQLTDDVRLLALIRGADEFERVARARVFLEHFPRSALRPRVLLLYAEAAEEAADKLSRDAERKLEKTEIPSDGAPEFSYFLNFSGLDRYNRQGAIFIFDRTTKQFHYEGWACRELVRKYPNSPQANASREHLESLSKINGR